MRRRTNKSSKVPNVKLRPADKGSRSRSATGDPSCWAQETQPGSDDTSPLDLCPRPFKGLVICATGILDKPTLFKQAVELGATHTPAFTDRVTHLIADIHGGPKYNCAVTRKIPIVKSSWIIENYQIWLRGDDVDVQNSIQNHRLPIFSGVVVCPSGIADITRRTEISNLVTAHEGAYVAKLERPVKVTHLLCSGDEETDKMRLAEKFKTRGEATVQLVWEEWFWDSLHYGGRFEEAPYHVRNPRPELKAQVETATPPPVSSDVGSQAISSPMNTHSPQQPDANNSEEAEEELAFVKVLPAVTLQLWSGLLERRGYQISDGEVILSPSKVNDKAEGKFVSRNPPISPVPPKAPAGRSVISSFRRANSFAPALHSKEVGSSSRQLPFRRAATSGATFHEAQAGPSDVGTSNHVPALQGHVPTASSAQQIFFGVSFRLLGEVRAQNVKHVIEERGGRISVDQDEDVDFVLVRLLSGSKFYQQEEDQNIRHRYRTECWLEHCVYEERVCLIDEQISFTPLSISIPVAGAEGIAMSLSGFEQSELCGLKRLLRALGINLATIFTRQSTFLLCRSGTGLKFDKAQDWGVPVVDLSWLRAICQTGSIPDPHDHVAIPALEPQQLSQSVLDTDENARVPIPSSASPSPMKVPSLQLSGSSRNSASPVKIDHEATKALQESIASLLGKRPSPDGEESNVDSGGTTGQQPARTGKRARPQRPQNRKAGPSKRNTSRPQTRASKAAMALPQNMEIDIDLSPNPFGVVYPEDVNLSDDGESQQDSVRVLYEDPAQRDEKRRLMNLLKETAASKGESGESETLSMSGGLRVSDRSMRRSARIAG